MSEFTFNIADYRPLSAVTTHRSYDRRSVPSGFVVLTSNSDSVHYEPQWLEARPDIVDIRSVRETLRMDHSSYARRGKVLRFTSETPARVCTMPMHSSNLHSEDDPDPMAA